MCRCPGFRQLSAKPDGVWLPWEAGETSVHKEPPPRPQCFTFYFGNNLKLVNPEQQQQQQFLSQWFPNFNISGTLGVPGMISGAPRAKEVASSSFYEARFL